MEFLANSDSEIYCKNKNSNIFEKCKNFLETYNEHDTYKLIKKEEKLVNLMGNLVVVSFGRQKRNSCCMES